MQQDPNLQVQWNVSQNTYEMNPYMPQNPQLAMQQGTVNQAVPGTSYGMQPGNVYPPQYSSPQVVLSANQLQAMNTSNSAHIIETRISAGFGCYTCLFYFELIVSILALISNIVSSSSIGGGVVALSVITNVTMIVACVLALIAKSNFDTRKQHLAFLGFIVGTVLNILCTVLVLVGLEGVKNDTDQVCSDNSVYYQYDDQYSQNCQQMIGDVISGFQIAVAIITIPVQLLIGFGLIFNARTLLGLMRERDSLINDARAKSNAV